MPCIISIVGKSSTGKTTFLEKLISELSGRGYKIATIKHSHHDIELDQPNKDTWRHSQAGARETIISANNGVQINKHIGHPLDLDELSSFLNESNDIILTEGFSQDTAPKIEIHRKDAGPLLENASNLLAIASDEPLDVDIKQFDLNDIKGVANLIEEKYLLKRKERVSLFVNGNKLPIEDISYRVIKDLLNTTSRLQGLETTEHVELYYYHSEEMK